MKTSELFKDKTVLSFEIFPPKPTDGEDIIYSTLDGLKGLKPDYISVTCGAGGQKTSEQMRRTTISTAATVKHAYGIESVAHMRGVDLNKESALEVLKELERHGINNILALRGDIVEGQKPSEDFPHADDLIKFIRENGDFDILAACYPEKHLECPTMAEDIRNLVKKVDAGASSLVSQLFLDNEDFYRFRDMCAVAGICVPVQAGIMPVTNKKSVERMVKMCGVKLPTKFRRIMDRYENDPVALSDAGIAYAVDQIVDLLASGVDGIHLYIMNKPYVARKICEAIKNLI